jgi:hypothetical protein
MSTHIIRKKESLESTQWDKANDAAENGDVPGNEEAILGEGGRRVPDGPPLLRERVGIVLDEDDDGCD